MIPPGQVARCEKHSARSTPDLRGPVSTEAVFLMKTPSAHAKSDLGNRFSPLIRHLTCGVFLQLVPMPGRDRRTRKHRLVAARHIVNVPNGTVPTDTFTPCMDTDPPSKQSAYIARERMNCRGCRLFRGGGVITQTVNVSKRTVPIDTSKCVKKNRPR